jgi:flagellar biosynthesis/type III secretory pathway M-ring protein FliF/YscJ
MIYSILNSRAVRERFRIAYALPEKASVEEEDINLEQLESERLNELSIDTGDMLLLPADLPDQWLLSGEKSLLQPDTMLTPGSDFDTSAFSTRADSFEKPKYAQLSEESMMKSELKNQIQTYVSEQPQEAVKLIRMLMNQDGDLEKSGQKM